MVVERPRIRDQASDVPPFAVPPAHQIERSEEAQHPAAADRAFPEPCQQPLNFADADHQRLVAELGVAPLPTGSALEHLARNRRDVPARLLQLVRDAIDHCIEQPDEHLHGIGHHFRIGIGMLGEHQQRLGLDIADRHQMLVGQNEADRVGGRVAFVDSVEHRHRHEDHAVFLVQPRRRLDLHHFSAGRDIGADQSLDQLFLFLGRVEQVDPHGLVGAIE